MRCALLIIPLLLSACAASHLPLSGRYASSLSQADVEQITALATSRRDFGHPPRAIIAIAPNRARIVTQRRSTGEQSWITTEYVVLRRNGIWVVDDRSYRATTERISVIN
jgi:hypothetical protein